MRRNRSLHWIEVTGDLREQWPLLVSIVLIVLLVSMAFLGRMVTPEPARLVDRSDWIGLQLEQQYADELAQLRQSADELATSLTGNNAIRAGLTHDRIQQRHVNPTLPVLEAERAVLLDANQLVYAYAAGQVSYDQAADAVRYLQSILIDPLQSVQSNDGQ